MPRDSGLEVSGLVLAAGQAGCVVGQLIKCDQLLPNHLNTHRMDLIDHQFGERVVDEPVLGDAGEAAESR